MASPHLIELEEALSRIKQACDGRTKNQLSPFFFMVGAGISFPSVPLAPAIVSECKKTASEYGRCANPKSKDPLDLYSHWFETAYGDAGQRQRYLRGLIEGKQITHANFRLSHLLLDNRISNIVVTTNFDDFLSKALTLFGKPHIVCDHPHTVGRINPTEPDLQIVHLHGTYWFYDCCNLRGELQDRALQSQQTTSTMASLLDMILWDRSPLVIGYSGWEGDVFMDALRRRLARPLGSNAYWFCFRRSLVASMPDWLKNSPNIRFVVPKEQVARSSGTDGTQSAGIVETRSEIGEQVKVTTLATGKDEVPSLPADKVLDKFIRAFDLRAPALTRDPLGFLAERLDQSLPKDEASDKDADIYAIKNVIDRVKKAKQREIDETDAAIVESSDSSFEALRDAMRRADYRKAINLGIQIPLAGLSVEQLNELSEAAWLAASKLYDNSEDEIAGYDLVVTISKRLSGLFPSQEPAKRERVALALYNKGVAFAELNRHEEAVTVYDQLVQLYGDAPQDELRVRVAQSLFNKGCRLGVLNRHDEELMAYDTLVQRYAEAPEEELRLQVAQALFNKGARLGVLNRHDEELTVYDTLVQRYGEAPEPAVREQAARALFNKAHRLGALNRHDEELRDYGEVVLRYGSAQEPGLLPIVTSALNGIGFQSIVDAKAFRLAGDEPSAQEKLKKAQESLTSAIERSPNDPIILGNEAYLAFLSGRKNESLELLRRAISLGGETIREGELGDADINRLPEDDEFCEMVRSIPTPSLQATNPVG